MRRISNLFGTFGTQQPELHREHPETKTSDAQGRSPGGDPAHGKHQIRAGKARFLSFFKGAFKNNSRVQPDQGGGQSHKAVLPDDDARSGASRPMPTTLSRKNHRRFDLVKNPRTANAYVPPPDKAGGGAPVIMGDLVPATLFKKNHRNFAFPNDPGVPTSDVPSPGGPDGRDPVIMGDLVPATLFKNNHRNFAFPNDSGATAFKGHPHAARDGGIEPSPSDDTPLESSKKTGPNDTFRKDKDQPFARVPQTPAPDGDMQFSDSDLVPATVFKRDRRDSGIGLDDDIAPARIDLNPVLSDKTERETASRAYLPLKLKAYASGGTQDRVAVACTDYARQAAEMLIDEKGQLDTRYAANMMVDASEEQNLPAHFREHLIRTLKNLEEDPELAATVNGTCRHGPPEGPAKDNVRATLNLPPGVPVTEADARKALVMALLGDLRQKNVSDCFAAAPAICLHADSPVVVATHIKEMLEHNWLTFDYEGVTSQVPFNRQFNTARAQVPLSVKADGTCRGIAAAGGKEAAYELHDTPGMRAALTALGVPETEMQYEVGAALWQMGLQDDRDHEVSCKQVIEHIARARSGAVDPGKLISSALHAFSAQETVGLLRAWEFTLAAKGAAYDVKTQAEAIVSEILYGEPTADKPHLQSLEKKSLKFQERLASQRRFQHVPLARISDKLFAEMEKQMHQRFCRLYDPDAERDTVSPDGVSDRGGWVLYDRTPADDPKKWQRVDTAEKFQDAMADIVEQACDRAGRKTGGFALDGYRADSSANREALRQIADGLVEHILDDAFIEHAESRFTNGTTYTSPDEILWKGVSGGSTRYTVAYCGGDLIDSKTISDTRTSDRTGAAANDEDEADATEVARFLCQGLSKMTAQLQAKRNESHAGFRIPVSNGVHGFTLLPREMEDVWLGGATPDQWIDKALVRPATQHFNESRLNPPLFGLLEDLGDRVGMDRQEINQVYQRIADRSPRLRNIQQPYSLRAINEALKEHFKNKQDGSETLTQAQEILESMFPVPKPRIIADTNWANDGDPVYLGVLYNPIKERVELHSMDRDGGNRQLREGKWLVGTWRLYAPLPTRPA